MSLTFQFSPGDVNPNTDKMVRLTAVFGQPALVAEGACLRVQGGGEYNTQQRRQNEDGFLLCMVWILVFGLSAGLKIRLDGLNKGQNMVSFLTGSPTGLVAPPGESVHAEGREGRKPPNAVG